MRSSLGVGAGADRPCGTTQEGQGHPIEGLIRALEANDRFRRDGRLGGIFHPGRISFREICPTDSLHIVIDGSKVSAHVDEVCPLRTCEGGTARYSWPLVLAHNISGAAADLRRRLRGQQRCNLGCEVHWVDEEQIAQQVAARTGDRGACDHQGDPPAPGERTTSP